MELDQWDRDAALKKNFFPGIIGRKRGYKYKRTGLIKEAFFIEERRKHS
jgi:hypothetical protein